MATWFQAIRCLIPKITLAQDNVKFDQFGLSLLSCCFFTGGNGGNGGLNFEAGRFVQAFFVLGLGLRFLRSLLCGNSLQEKTEETEGLKWGLSAWIKLTSENSLVLSGEFFPGGQMLNLDISLCKDPGS